MPDVREYLRRTKELREKLAADLAPIREEYTRRLLAAEERCRQTCSEVITGTYGLPGNPFAGFFDAYRMAIRDREARATLQFERELLDDWFKDETAKLDTEYAAAVERLKCE